jgi:hypothetical protein
MAVNTGRDTMRNDDFWLLYGIALGLCVAYLMRLFFGDDDYARENYTSKMDKLDLKERPILVIIAADPANGRGE